MKHACSDRRAFLVNVSALTLVASLASACGDGSSVSDETLTDLRQRLKQIVEANEEALDFGRLYLADRPEENGQEGLLASIADALKPFQGDDLTAVKQAIEADYATSHVISLDGWQVSEVEARIYAILYLESQS